MNALDGLQGYALAHPFAAVAWTSITALILQFVYRGYCRRKFYRNKPGPPHSWLLGHLPIMAEMAALFPPNCHPQAYYSEILRRYKLTGPMYIDLWPVGPASLVVSEPDDLDQFTAPHLAKGVQQHPMAAEFMEPVVGEPVVATVNGPVWKKLHKAMAPAFSWAHIRHLTRIIVEECLIFREHLDKVVASGEIMNLEHDFAKLSFDVISRTVLNYSLNAQTTGSQDLEDMRGMIHLLEGQADIAVQFNPVERLKRWFKRRQILARFNPSIVTKIYDRLQHLVDESIVPDKRAHVSILDLMLRDHLETNMATGKSKGEAAKLSAEDEKILVTNIKALLLGGHGTTTDTLVFMTLLLSKNPDALAKMREEHDAVFGKSHEATVETLLSSPEKCQSLPYTDAVIKESMRLFPVGFGVREAPAGMTISHEGRSLPVDGGLAVCLNGHGLHYNAKYFPEPTRFLPERWLDDKNEIPRGYFRSFSRGERACAGQNLATNEMKIILLMTMRDYKFECVKLKPNEKPRGLHTDLDLVYGDWVFQELGMEAKPRPGMDFKVGRV